MGSLNTLQAKKWLKDNWNRLSPEKLTEALNNYWKLQRKEKNENLVEFAEKLFDKSDTIENGEI